jgi:hypothetical protein
VGSRLVRLYPARWRERYGPELDQLVDDLRPTRPRRALALNLVRGAIDAHVQEGLAMLSTDRRAVSRGALVAGVVWLGLSVDIVLSNVVFPAKADNDGVSVVVSYLCVFAALGLVGALAARAGAGRRGQLLAGIVAGAMIGALTIATFAVVDNVWLDVVARQPQKVEGLARGGGGSMRGYINEGLLAGGALLTVGLGAVGALLSLAGGLVGRRPAKPVDSVG